jgi:arginyl-tRNA synthetase
VADALNAVQRLAARVSDVTGTEVELERPNDPAHGDFATNVALRTAPQHKRPPRELAAELAERLAGLEEIEKTDVAGPGFVNLWVTPAWLADAVAGIGPDFGSGSAAAPQKIQVELVSANPVGPLTVGSARNGAYGDSVARVLEYAGHSVEREYYFNEGGRQVELFLASIEARRSGRDVPEGGYQGEYITELAQLEVDPVQHMLEEIKREVTEFRIDVDTWQRQTEIEQEVPDVIPKLDTYEAEGTLWARTSAYGDDKDRPLLRSEDGSYLYYAADVAYVRDKLERGFDRAIYVLGADHHGYVPRLKAAAAMLGYDTERVEVLIYQLVHIVEGGEMKKISKRRGDVVFLTELIDKIGIDAARWYLVSRGHDQTIDIDVDLAAERTQKNPVYYVQYAHARIAGILRNAGDAQIGGEAPATIEREERELIKRLTDFPQVAAEAAERRAPHGIPIYAIRVADDFHRFYHEHRVVGSDAETFRLGLCRATQSVIARCLNLIGVEAPERM